MTESAGCLALLTATAFKHPQASKLTVLPFLVMAVTITSTQRAYPRRMARLNWLVLPDVISANWHNVWLFVLFWFLLRCLILIAAHHSNCFV